MYEGQKPDRVYMSYGGLGYDVPIERDYIPASLPSAFLTAHTFVKTEIEAGRLDPQAMLHLAGADAGRMLILTAPRDAKLDMDVLNKRFDPAYQAGVLRREEQEEDPRFRLILVKAAIRKALIDALGNYLGFSRLSGNTSVTEALAENSNLSETFFDFVRNAYENLGKDIFAGDLLKKRELRQRAAYTLPRRLRQSVVDKALAGIELDQQILYSLAQGGFAAAEISQGHLYISPRAQNDPFSEEGRETTPTEILRETTAQVVVEIMGKVELGKEIYNPSSGDGRWQLREELIGRSLNERGELKLVDTYAALGANGDGFSRHPRIFDGNNLQFATAEVLDETVVPTGNLTKGPKALIEADINSVLRAWIKHVLGHEENEGLFLARFRTKNPDEIQDWLDGKRLFPGRTFPDLAKLYQGFAMGIAKGVRRRIEQTYGVSYEQFVQ